MKKNYDAVIVGSGPNGLACAIALAQAKLSVLLIEGKETIGGGMRSAELTLPGFSHDICSAIHPLALSSPFFKSLPLEKYGLNWIQPDAPMVHPFLDGTSVVLERSIDKTCEWLGKDGAAYKQLMGWLTDEWEKLAPDLLSPLHFPKHPLLMARFGFYGLRTAQGLATQKFSERAARSLFAGLAAHSIMPLDKWATAAFGLILGTLGHAVGWPMPVGGTQSLANALASHFVSIGGEIITGTMVNDLAELPSSPLTFLDVTPKQLLQICGKRLPANFQKSLSHYRYGPAVFKIDWALSDPIPWKNRECARAGTIHIGGNLEEIASSEREVWNGQDPQNRFIILAQPTLFDPSRAPPEKHVAWAYCHVPNGSTLDMKAKIESQIEALAPGFKECIIGRSTLSPQQLETYNPNYVGGDINGGVQDFGQLFSRPVSPFHPYKIPIKGLYLCSSSTPPGGGVHGMCGYHAARAALNCN